MGGGEGGCLLGREGEKGVGREARASCKLAGLAD